NRRCLNGSDAALDTKAIRQKRGRHRAEKIALTDEALGMPWFLFCIGTLSVERPIPAPLFMSVVLPKKKQRTRCGGSWPSTESFSAP
ncbi:hypothetical protein, partial [Bradyrhizobium sp. CW9]|uniref:hypothetical protein n=1 Tax=Bradyrhizobium sp. CW9 TaxID=2782689 RepID=UPI001FF7D90F